MRRNDIDIDDAHDLVSIVRRYADMRRVYFPNEIGSCRRLSSSTPLRSSRKSCDCAPSVYVCLLFFSDAFLLVVRLKSSVSVNPPSKAEPNSCVLREMRLLFLTIASKQAE